MKQDWSQRESQIEPELELGLPCVLPVIIHLEFLVLDGSF